MMFQINFAAFQRIREKISTVSLEGTPVKHNIFYYEDNSFLYFYLPYDNIVYYSRVEKQEITDEMKQTLTEIKRYGEQLVELPDKREVALKISTG